MALFRVFKTPKHQKFEYRPRYWDPDKDKLKHRLKKFEEGSDKDPEAMKKRIASGFQRGGRGGGNPAVRGRYIFRSNMILLGIIIALLFVSYFFISVYLPNFIEMFEGGGL